MKTILKTEGLLQKSFQIIKSQKLILALFIGLISHTEVSAHASTITRKWCGGFFHRKFVAQAQTSVLSYKKYVTGYNCIGQFVGYGNVGLWSSTCSNESKGCSRPQTAICSKSGTVYDQVYNVCTLSFTGPYAYNSYAKAEHLTSGIYLTQTSSGRGSAGLTGSYTLDEKKFSKLVDNGTSFGEITGDVTVNDNNQLVVTKMNGRINITPSADFYSNVKIVIIKENVNISDDEAFANEQAVQNGTYPDVVYTATVHISKNGLTYDGIFKNGFISNQIKEYATAQEKGVSFSNFSSSVPINVNLNDDEKLTLVTVMDGGFDISTAVVQKNANTAIDNTLSSDTPKLTPNPAKDYVDVNMNLEKRELIIVRIISSLGKIAAEKSETLNSGKQSIRLHTDQLLPGTYIVEIKSPSKTASQKLLITR